MRFFLELIAFVLMLSGCATTQSVTAGKVDPKQPFSSAAIAAHGGKSVDMDIALQNALSVNGVPVKAMIGEGEYAPANVDVVVTYAATWRWDITMQLSKLTIGFYDARTSELLGVGTRENGMMNGTQDNQKVVTALVNEILQKIRPPRPVSKRY